MYYDIKKDFKAYTIYIYIWSPALPNLAKIEVIHLLG